MLTHTLFYNFTAGIKAHTENYHLITRGCPLSNTALWASLSLFTNNFYNFLYYLLPHNQQWYLLISITKYRYPFFILLVYLGIRIAAVLHFNTLSYLSLTESYSFYMPISDAYTDTWSLQEWFENVTWMNCYKITIKRKFFLIFYKLLNILPTWYQLFGSSYASRSPNIDRCTMTSNKTNTKTINPSAQDHNFPIDDQGF